jgi:hypothetical protein
MLLPSSLVEWTKNLRSEHETYELYNKHVVSFGSFASTPINGFASIWTLLGGGAPDSVGLHALAPTLAMEPAFWFCFFQDCTPGDL